MYRPANPAAAKPKPAIIALVYVEVKNKFNRIRTQVSVIHKYLYTNKKRRRNK